MLITLVGIVALVVPALIPGSEAYFYIITAQQINGFTKFDTLLIASAVLFAYEIYNIITTLYLRFRKEK